MKKIYLLFCFSFLVLIAKAQFPAPYCAEDYVTNVEPITLVVMGNINNASSDITGGSPHEDYTSISTTVTQGVAYSITVKGNTDGPYTDYISVFVDWNQDGDFDDAGETYNIGTIFSSTGLDSKSVTGSIQVPLTAIVGSTRMRVAKHYDSYQLPCNAGGFGEYGEAEDYTLNVVASPSCTGTPPIAIASGPASSCSDSLIVVSLSGITAGTGLTFQWQSTTLAGTNWLPVSGATSAIATITHPAGGAKYRCMITCTSSTQSSISTEITVQSINCAPPINDDPCDAITLVLDGPSDCQNTKYATSNNDPTFNCSTPNNTTWYKYTPTTTGLVQFTFKAPMAGDTLLGWLGVYTVSGACPGGLTFTNETAATLGNCKSFGNPGDSTTVFAANLTAGIEYYFMVDGVSGAMGNYCMSIQTPPNPPTTCATLLSPTNAAIDINAPIATIRWSPVALATSYDIYFGTTNPPTIKIGSSGLDSSNITGLSYNTTYYWYIVPINTGGAPTGCDANTYSFTTMAPPPPPVNDDCTGAIAITAGTPVNATTISATQTMAGELCNGFTGTADDDVWFTFTAVQNGDATISLIPSNGSSFDAVIIAYSGSCGSFTTIGCADSGVSGDPETVSLTGLNAGETYYFRVYSYGSSITSQGNFTINASGSALPVSITKFSGVRKGNENLLVWTTASESNNKGFEIQHSSTENNFLPIIFIESKATNGNSATILNYQFTDNKPYAGNTFYRLKQIDINGKASYSNIISIKGDKISKLVITDIYPNPASKLLNMTIASPTDENVQLVITDITGKILQKQAAQLNTGNNNLHLQVDALASGTYMLQVICNNGCNSSVVKFVKQ